MTRRRWRYRRRHKRPAYQKIAPIAKRRQARAPLCLGGGRPCLSGLRRAIAPPRNDRGPRRRAPRPHPPWTTHGVPTAAARPRPAPVAGATVSGLLTGCRSGRRPLPARGRHSDLGELHTPAASSGPGAGSTSVRKQRTTAACAQTSARIAAGRRLLLGIPRVRPLDRPFVRAVS